MGPTSIALNHLSDCFSIERLDLLLQDMGGPPNVLPPQGVSNLNDCLLVVRQPDSSNLPSKVLGLVLPHRAWSSRFQESFCFAF